MGVTKKFIRLTSGRILKVEGLVGITPCREFIEPAGYQYQLEEFNMRWDEETKTIKPLFAIDLIYQDDSKFTIIYNDYEELNQEIEEIYEQINQL